MLSQRRVWIAAGAVLAYLVMRHRFSKENKAGFEAMKDDWASVETRLLRMWLSVETVLMSRMNHAKTPLLGGFERIMTKVTVGLRAQPPVLARCAVEGVYRGVNVGGAMIKRDQCVTVSLTVEQLLDGKLLPVPSVTLVCQIGRLGRALKFCAGGVWLILYSRTSLSFLAPWALAALAGGLILRRLWNIW